MSFTTKQDVEARQQDERFEQQCAVGLDDIYRAYPTLVRCEATSKLIRSLINTFMDGAVVPTVPLFEMMLEENPNCGLPVKSVQEQRADLIEEICGLLRSPNGDGKGGKHSDTDLANYRRNVLAYQSKEQLQQRKANILEAQRLQKLSPEAIRAEEKAKRKQDILSGQLPPDMTAAKLKASIPMLKFAIRNFGCDAVNRRLNGQG